MSDLSPLDEIKYALAELGYLVKDARASKLTPEAIRHALAMLEVLRAGLLACTEEPP